jgi:protein TonB
VSEISAHYEFEDCIIRYTLEGSKSANVILYATQDNEKTWTKLTEAVSGDVGPAVEPGDRIIIVRGFNEAQAGDLRFKLVIDDKFNFTVGLENLTGRDTVAINSDGNTLVSSDIISQERIGFTEISVTEEAVKDPPPPPPIPAPSYTNEGADYYSTQDYNDNLVGEVEVITVLPQQEGPEEPVSFAQEMPQYPGGELQMQKDIMENSPYPEMEKANNIQGKVYVSFAVEKDGSVSNVRVVRGVKDGPNLSIVAENAIKQLKRFTPAKQNGRPVRLKMTVPVNFTL